MNPTFTDLVIPDELAAALSRATGPVALRTQSGQKLGRYTPEPQFGATEFSELMQASESSLAFWNNPLDDEDWNDAGPG
ncbi:MAG TPA: hypothetical protein VL371_16725 [Gemmataceae bacterium]|nr:hypothetical protein [Gemmataceae bacterium]